MISPSSFPQAIVLKAWVELTSGREMTVKKAGRLFDAGLQQNKDPFGYIGRARSVVTAADALFLLTDALFPCAAA